MRILLRTYKEFTGVVYAVGFEGKAGCFAQGTNENVTRIIIARKSCGVHVEQDLLVCSCLIIANQSSFTDKGVRV
jgi:hypothetical protein